MTEATANVPDPGKRKGHFTRFFLRGLGALLPTLLTLALLAWLARWLYVNVGQYISRGAYWVLQRTPWAGVISESAWYAYVGWWFGFAVAVVAVYVFGRFVATYVGRWLWRMTERTVTSMPLIRGIYPHIKQVTDFMLTDHRKKHFEQANVVAVEYPRKGTWSVGLVTGGGMQSIRDRAGEDLVTIFIPSSPTPFTGYTIVVKKREIVELPITFDEALRYTVSGGVLTPPRQLPAEERTEPAGALREAQQALPSHPEETSGKEKQQ